MARLGLSSPWVIYYREIYELFRFDPDIRVIYDEENNEVKLYVEDAVKADALMELLPTEKAFGNVSLKITVVPADNAANAGEEKLALIEKAFKNNPIVNYIKTVHGIFATDFHYVVFMNKVVQYFNDDISDAHGVKSTLYEEIARNIFGEDTPGVYFSTDIGLTAQSFNAPLGEWP